MTDRPPTTNPVDSKMPAPARRNTLNIDDRALSVPQPFAELILRGVKRVETRSWAPDWRGRIGIYSAAWSSPASDLAALIGHPIIQAECACDDYLGHVDLVDCHPAETCRTCGIWGADVGYHWVLDNPARRLNLTPSSPRHRVAPGDSTPRPQMRT